jgi:predicted nucleic acid-binding protein
MRYLLDTGILLRLVNQQAEAHATVRRSVARIKAGGHETVTAFQNRAEFWNVCTRPESAGRIGLRA